MRLSSLFASLVLGSVALMGCSAPVSSLSDSEASVDGIVEETSEALVTAASRASRDAFVGSFVAGARTLTLEANGTYGLDTGIRCIKAPCPSFEEGRWSVARKSSGYQVTLAPKSGTKTVLTACNEGGRLVSTKDASVAFEKIVVATNPCAATLCPTSSVCEAIDGEAHCIALDVCARVRCPGDTTCVADGNSATCVPVEPTLEPTFDTTATCALMLCAANTVCVEGAGGARCKPID